MSGKGGRWLALAALWSGSVLADTTQTADTDVSAAPLQQIDLETHAPVRIITRSELARLAHLPLGDVIQRLPFMGGSAPNLNSNAGGNGSVPADISGLGRARCIVMLNGHRLPVNEFLAAPAVDLSSIPLAVVDRIEVVLGGASPTWGADAVSGVINIITRPETDGMDATLASATSGKGDASSHRASLFGGRVVGRGYANFAVEYRRQQPVDSSARDYSQQGEALGCDDESTCIWPFGSTITPGGVFSLTQENKLDLAPGRYVRGADGGYRPFQAFGPENDLYSTASDTLVRAGRTGGSVAASVSYELFEASTFTLDLLASKDRVRRQLAPLPLTTTVDGITPQYDPKIGTTLESVPVSAGNYYNPFGVDLSEVRRRLVELGPRSFTDDSDMMFSAATLRQPVGPWQIEGAVSWGRSTVAEDISHVVDTGNLLQALGDSGPDANGVIRCGVRDPETGIVTVPEPDCVPLNVFGGPGTVSQEMLDFVTKPESFGARTNQSYVSVMGRRELGLRGFRSPAQLAVGIESRRLSARSDPPRETVIVLRDEPQGRGNVEQHDLIGELTLPFLDSHRVHSPSTVTLGTRLSWFEARSMIASAFAGTAWRLSADWMLRGRITQVYRSPSAGELFLGPRTGALAIGNPCGGNTDRSCDLVPGFIELDDAEGLTDTTELSYSIAGNSKLMPERGISASTGVVWSSSDGLDRFVSLDLTSVRLKDTIRSPGVLELFTACRDGGAPLACDRLLSSTSGSAVLVDGSLLNGGRDELLRLDLDSHLAGSTRWGDWRAAASAGYLLRRRVADIQGNGLQLRGTFDVTQSITGTAYPTLRVQTGLQWSRGPLSALWAVQYIGDYDEVTDRNGWLTPVDGKIRTVSAAMYHDLAMAWSAQPSWTFRVNVENLFDASPPRVNNGFESNTDAASYRLGGRMFSVSLEMSR